nr:MAG TPA: hypothetical protein [Caudoviricetes sp.]
MSGCSLQGGASSLICRRNNGTARRSKRRNETLPHKQG